MNQIHQLKKLLFSLAIVFASIASLVAQTQTTTNDVINLRCEFLQMPLGIDIVNPALSWNINDDSRGVVQTSYRILVATSEDLLENNIGDLWDSGEIKSDKSQLVIYKGKALTSRLRCYWKVALTTKSADGTLKTITSSPSWWEMGLLNPSDWTAKWIQSPVCKPVMNNIVEDWMRMSLIPQEVNNRVIMNGTNLWEPARLKGREILGKVLPIPAFRTSFEVKKKIKKARLYISGLGFQESFVNGKAVSNRMHDPSVTFYEKRGGYITHDITSLIRSGKNDFSAIVGGGWWNEPVVWGDGKVYGDPSLKAQIEIVYEDGTSNIIATNNQWRTAIGPMLKSHYYAGEAYDARLANGWLTGENNQLKWVSSIVVNDVVPVLEAQLIEPERVIQRIKPVSVTQPRPEIYVYDFGQILVGTVELNVKAKSGTEINMRSAEWTWNPEKQGPKFTSNLLYYDNTDITKRTKGMIIARPRGQSYLSTSFSLKETTAKLYAQVGVPTLTYVANGDANGEKWNAAFTNHAFRYIEVQGLDEEPTLDLLTGLVISSDEEVIGEFTSGNERFNDFWEASMNSTRFLTHGMTWDNGHERLQSQVYHSWSAPFASYMLWYPNMWRKVMEDLRLIGSSDPDSSKFGMAVYGKRQNDFSPRNMVTQSVNIELPMVYYNYYGDIREIEKQYPLMKAFINAFIPNKDGDIYNRSMMGAWNDHFYYEMSLDGKWTPTWSPQNMITIMLYEYTLQTASIAKKLNKLDDAQYFEELAENIKEKTNEKWYNKETKTYAGAKIESSAADNNQAGKVIGGNMGAGAKDSVDNSLGWHGMMAMAVAKGVAPQKDVDQLVENIILDMKMHYNNHPSTGHITAQILYDVLVDHGMIETTYDMMNATGFPSFTWMLQSGNKVIPEGPTEPEYLPARYSAYQNEMQEPARWFTESLCGIKFDPEQPGFKHFTLTPHFPSRLPFAKLKTTTPYGEAESSWVQADGKITWTVKIPANSSATATIPISSATQLTESGQPISTVKACKALGQSKKGMNYELGSGTYVFKFPAPKNLPSRLSEWK